MVWASPARWPSRLPSNSTTQSPQGPIRWSNFSKATVSPRLTLPPSSPSSLTSSWPTQLKTSLPSFNSSPIMASFVLRRSLEKQINPSISFLKSVLPSDKEIAPLLSAKRGTWVLHKFSQRMVPNIETLRSHGVPDSNIFRMLIMRPRTLAFNVDEFKGIIERITKMGFDEKGLMFIHGVCALSGMKEAKWNSKVSVFRSFGWEEEEVIALFVKQPKCMNSSEARIRKSLDLFMNELHWMPGDITKYPTVLFLSFEKRVKPRSCVLKPLIEKGLVGRSSMGSVFIIPEYRFLNKFMSSFGEKIPDLLEVYQSNKMGLLQSAVPV